jgi:hypothetical protein
MRANSSNDQQVQLTHLKHLMDNISSQEPQFREWPSENSLHPLQLPLLFLSQIHSWGCWDGGHGRNM